MKTWKEELAWAAGFFDGEGHISRRVNDAAPPQVIVGQHYDPVCLHRFQAAVLGIGKVYGPYIYKTKPNNGPAFMYKVSSFENGQAVIAMLWKFLSEPKRQVIEEIYLDYKISYRIRHNH
jgi:hypothetical protein